MSWRAVLGFLHLLPLAPKPIFRATNEQHEARLVAANHEETASQARSTVLDIIETQQLDPRRAAMKRDAAALRETLAAVAERADRRWK